MLKELMERKDSFRKMLKVRYEPTPEAFCVFFAGTTMDVVVWRTG